MKYTYKNLKMHCTISGIPPGETRTFDEPIIGGGLMLIEEKTEKKIVPIRRNKKNGDEI